MSEQPREMEGQEASAEGVTPFRSIYVGPWRVDLTDRHGSAQLPAPRATLARTIAATLDATGAPSPASVALVLSNDAELADLNQRHMGHDGPTDVLSFPLLAPELFPVHPRGAPPAEPALDRRPTDPPRFVLPGGRRTHLGDIIVSVERALAQASEGRGGQTGDVRWSPAEELRLLVIHGTLHLCGWDHEDRVEGEAMRALEQQVLDRSR